MSDIGWVLCAVLFILLVFRLGQHWADQDERIENDFSTDRDRQ